MDVAIFALPCNPHHHVKSSFIAKNARTDSTQLGPTSIGRVNRVSTFLTFRVDQHHSNVQTHSQRRARRKVDRRPANLENNIFISPKNCVSRVGMPTSTQRDVFQVNIDVGAVTICVLKRQIQLTKVNDGRVYI